MAEPVDVPEEHIERPSGNMFGKMLKRYRSTKDMAITDAKNKLFERHKVTVHNRNKFKVVIDKTVDRNGAETTELRLYELVDAAVVTIKPDVSTDLQGGISNLREFNRDEK